MHRDLFPSQRGFWASLAAEKKTKTGNTTLVPALSAAFGFENALGEKEFSTWWMRIQMQQTRLTARKEEKP